MSKAIAKFIEHECLIGTADKADGLSKVTRGVTAAAEASVTADELIDLQESIPDVYQAGACWIHEQINQNGDPKTERFRWGLSPEPRCKRKMGYTLLGKDVYCSDAMQPWQQERL